MTDPLLLVVVTLAAARITHLVTTDTIARPFRDLFADNPLLDELFNCPWCVGFWVAVAAVGALVLLPSDLLFILALPWAISYLIGFLEGITNREPVTIDNGD